MRLISCSCGAAFIALGALSACAPSTQLLVSHAPPPVGTCEVASDLGIGGSGMESAAPSEPPIHIRTNSRRVLDILRNLRRDPSIGEFVNEMAADPEMTYFVWEAELKRNGGGVTQRCNEHRFDVWVDLDFHLSLEGRKCTNPAGSGSLSSLVAHELGHAWAWNNYGDDNLCDNNSLGNRISVAWENTQLAGRVERPVHNREGCPCDPHRL